MGCFVDRWLDAHAADCNDEDLRGVGDLPPAGTPLGVVVGDAVCAYDTRTGEVLARGTVSRIARGQTVIVDWPRGFVVRRFSRFGRPVLAPGSFGQRVRLRKDTP